MPRAGLVVGLLDGRQKGARTGPGSTDFVLNLTKSGYFSGFRTLGTDFVLNLAKSCCFGGFKNRPGRAHRSIFGWIGAFWGLPGCARSIVDYRRGLIGGSSEAHRRLIARRLIARSSVHFRLVCSFFGAYLAVQDLSSTTEGGLIGGSSEAHRRLIARRLIGPSSVLWACILTISTVFFAVFGCFLCVLACFGAFWCVSVFCCCFTLGIPD